MTCTGLVKDTLTAKCLVEIIAAVKKHRTPLARCEHLLAALDAARLRPDISTEALCLMRLTVWRRKPGKMRRSLDRALWDFDAGNF